MNTEDTRHAKTTNQGGRLGAIKVTSAIANSNYLILQVVTSSLIAPYY